MSRQPLASAGERAHASRETEIARTPAPAVATPRLGFIGLGAIGRARLQEVLDAGVAHAVVVADIDPLAAAAAARGCAAGACASLDVLLQRHLDGVVIATPSALHAAQATAALERRCAVFCHQPLARTAAEAAQVVATAHAYDRLVSVDCGYRGVPGMATLREQVRAGDLGEVYAIDLVFHSARGPEKAWCYDVTQSGGGCVMDLGVHLIDLAMWMTGCSGIEGLDAQLFQRGRRLLAPVARPEDYARVQYRLATGACVRMACSWNWTGGADALIVASFHGTRGGATLRNVGGSARKFTLDRHDGTRHTRLAGPAGARDECALVEWARRIAQDPHFDRAARHLVDVASIVDRIYGR